MLKLKIVREIQLQADELVNSLFALSEQTNVCLLDSCGVSYLDSHLLIAGIKPVKILEISGKSAEETLNIFENEILQKNSAAIFTISYDFGLKLEKIEPRPKEIKTFDEPDIFLALFDSLIVHDYKTRRTYISGNRNRLDEIENLLFKSQNAPKFSNLQNSKITSNFSRDEYLEAVEKIKEYIRRGDTYQTNLTQQIRADLPQNLTPQQIFRRLRKNHPAPFAAFIKRKNDFIVSISPERFFKVQSPKSKVQSRIISTSPIKGTRKRGKTDTEDLFLRRELLNSAKDRAENIMIVDLLRNDLGRICKFGSVTVEKLCDLETHPTFFHLVSTVLGKLREKVSFSDIIRAVFPCGSITGAPKIRTMQIIDELETANRGLSMGAIGCFIPNSGFPIPNLDSKTHEYFDLSVAIRTMVIKNREAIFNVGGGIVIDSVPENEYKETFVKARALIEAINGKF